MTILDEFERQTGKLAREITKPEMIEVMEDPANADLFSSPEKTMAIIKGISEMNRDKEMAKEMMTVYYEMDLDLNERKMEGIFSRYKDGSISRAELEDDMRKEMSSKEPIESLTAYLCAMIALPNIDLGNDKAAIYERMDDASRMFDDIGSIETSYPLYEDLLDLIYQTRSAYTERYQEDALPEDARKRLDGVNKRMDDFEFNVIEKGKFPSANISPEDIGLIDITKMRGKKEENGA